MSDYAEQLDELVAHAHPKDLIRALSLRGARTRRLSVGERVKVSLTLDVGKARPGRPRGFKVPRPARSDDPRLNF